MNVFSGALKFLADVTDLSDPDNKSDFVGLYIHLKDGRSATLTDGIRIDQNGSTYCKHTHFSDGSWVRYGGVPVADIVWAYPIDDEQEVAIHRAWKADNRHAVENDPAR